MVTVKQFRVSDVAFPNNLPPLPHSPFPHKKWQREAAELFGRRWQGGVDGNVKALAAVQPLTLAVALAAAAAAAVGAGGGSGTCFARLASGSGC